MEALNKKRWVLIAEDDPDDQLLITQAFENNEPANAFRFVKDGEELMDFLRNIGKCGDMEKCPGPDLILLDLNMPHKDGREALAEIKSDPGFRHIPTVIFTTSKSTEDIDASYQLGADAFVTKSDSFESFKRTLNIVTQYWLETVKLPTRTI